MTTLRDLTEDEIRQALSFVKPDSRETWVKMAFAIKSELGDTGFDMWDDWSREGNNYDERAARHVWKSGKVGGSVSIGTLIYEAKTNGFNLEKPEIQTLTDEEIAERQRVRKAIRAQSAKEERESQKAAAIAANEIWNSSQTAIEHPYLESKGVNPYGLRVGKWPLRTRYGEVYGEAENVLLIPMLNEKGELTSLQGVFDKVPKGYSTNKAYLKDGKKAASWHTIGHIGDMNTIALTEGYATGATARALTGWCVIVCFDRTNIARVAELLRPMTQGQRMVILADNDQWTDGNPGVTDAKKAANAVMAEVLIPAFQPESIRAWQNKFNDGQADDGPTDFNDLLALESADVVREQLGIKPPAKQPIHDEPANDNEPFYPLGYNNGEYFYMVSGTQQITSLSASQHSKSNLMGLASLMYWSMEYPAKNGPAWDVAADVMMRQCEQKGFFSRKVIRGRGAWVDEGRTVFHFGSSLWVDGETRRLTQIKSKYIYELGEEINSPSKTALSDAEGRELVEISQMFRWTKPANAALLAGFVAIAPLCGALKWRPHIWVTGGAGSGKSTVMDHYIHVLLNGMNIFAQGNSTEAGLRQTLKSDALPVLFDESEQNNDKEVYRVQNMLSLVRQASSESAAKTYKGSATGDAIHYIIKSMFCLSSIQVGMKQQADIERVSVLSLKPKEGNTDAAGEWEKLKERLYRIKRDEDLPARLFKRSLELLPVTTKNIDTFVTAAAEKFGSLREGDQYGSLLAGCWSLTHKGVATHAQAVEMIDSYDWDELRENTKVNESNLALNAILSAELRTPVGGTASVYEVVCRAAGRAVEGVGITQSEANAVLSRAGMRVEGAEFWLSNNSTKIPELLRSTVYASDWRGQVSRVEGVTKSDGMKKFNGTTSRYLIVPLSIFDDGPSSGELPF